MSEHRLPELPSPRAESRQPLGSSGSSTGIGAGRDVPGTSLPTGSICPSDAAIALRLGAGTRIRPTAFGFQAASRQEPWDQTETLVVRPEKTAPEQDGERHCQCLGTAQNELQKGSAGHNCVHGAAPVHRGTRDMVGHGHLQETN